MVLVAFDTLKYAERLEKAGFPRGQAAELAEVQSETLADLMQEKLATKDDLKALRIDLKTQIVDTQGKLQKQIDDFKSELALSNSALRSEMHELSGALKLEISTLKIQMQETHSALLRWIIGLFISGIGVLSVVMSLSKFFQSP